MYLALWALTCGCHLAFGVGDHGCLHPAPELAEVIARTAIEVLTPAYAAEDG